ncbi:MAG: hypothetical protein AB7K24_20995 [Gemmataceae bacterium]
MPFAVENYGPVVAEVYDENRLQPLGPGQPNQAMKARLAALTADRLFQGKVRDPQMASLCLAALWLLHDFLDDSHKICQEVETPSGSYWHAIMHRREPDASNSKYWFRRVGHHPVLAEVGQAARKLAGEHSDVQADCLRSSSWDPFAFVDLCDGARPGSDVDQLCRLVQHAEWQLLFDYCYQHG